MGKIAGVEASRKIASPQTRKGYFILYPYLLTMVLCCIIGPALADPTAVDTSSFNTSANFSVDNQQMALSSAIATIEARPNAPGYSWLRIHFYSFPLAAEDVAGALNGNVESMDRKRTKKASNPKDYNTSNAVIQLSVDSNFKVWQVDMAVPGHTCTIAPYEPDVKKFLQNYQFDGTNLRLTSRGSYLCDMKFMGIPDQNFAWNIDLTATVFAKVNAKK